MKNITYIFLIVTGIMSACSSKENKTDSLKNLDQLHNEVMAVNETAIKYKLLLDSILDVKKNNHDGDTIAIRKTIVDLETADEQMMDWMQSFNHEFRGSATETSKYFANQIDSLKQIQASLNQAISNSKQFIKS